MMDMVVSLFRARCTSLSRASLFVQVVKRGGKQKALSAYGALLTPTDQPRHDAIFVIYMRALLI